MNLPLALLAAAAYADPSQGPSKTGPCAPIREIRLPFGAIHRLEPLLGPAGLDGGLRERLRRFDAPLPPRAQGALRAALLEAAAAASDARPRRGLVVQELAASLEESGYRGLSEERRSAALAAALAALPDRLERSVEATIAGFEDGTLDEDSLRPVDYALLASLGHGPLTRTGRARAANFANALHRRRAMPKADRDALDAVFASAAPPAPAPSTGESTEAALRSAFFELSLHAHYDPLLLDQYARRFAVIEEDDSAADRAPLLAELRELAGSAWTRVRALMPGPIWTASDRPAALRRLRAVEAAAALALLRLLSDEQLLSGAILLRGTLSRGLARLEAEHHLDRLRSWRESLDIHALPNEPLESGADLSGVLRRVPRAAAFFEGLLPELRAFLAGRAVMISDGVLAPSRLIATAEYLVCHLRVLAERVPIERGR